MLIYKREKYLTKIRPFYNADDLIKVITGIRRCGKSSIMQMIMDELCDRGVTQENIIYLDLDKYGYTGIRTSKQLEELISNCLANSKDGLKYLFIDEIQNVKDFEIVLNAFRGEGNVSIFITGSNSYLLSGELATKLTGRYLEFEVYTLTFDEYLEMKKFYNKEVDANLNKELSKYLTEGGFPRTITIDDEGKKTYVEGVVKEIFEKDIKRRVKIKDVSLFESVRNFIINNYSATFSINNLCEALSNNGIVTTRTTVSKYIQILLDAKVLYECKRFDIKSKKSLANEKKYYLADISIYNSFNTDNRINYGSSLENIFYLYARSYDYAISIGKIGNLECEFILRKNGEYAYAQVSYLIGDSIETENREYRPLEAIKDNYPKYVFSADYLLQKRNGIHHCNIMEFMMNKEQVC